MPRIIEDEAPIEDMPRPRRWVPVCRRAGVKWGLHDGCGRGAVEVAREKKRRVNVT